uniref:Putative secreted protein n=1 Tax=Anopheles triannulatus TaxID=58253 RepID=A0A2M4B510_9DIPT
MLPTPALPLPPLLLPLLLPFGAMAGDLPPTPLLPPPPLTCGDAPDGCCGLLLRGGASGCACCCCCGEETPNSLSCAANLSKSSGRLGGSTGLKKFC